MEQTLSSAKEGCKGMARPLVWLVVEVHCYLKPVGLRVSIWISGRPLSDDKAAEEDVAVKTDRAGARCRGGSESSASLRNS